MISAKKFVTFAVNHLLQRFGLRLVRTESLLDWDVCLKRFRALGFIPKTVIDVGVATGTPELYRNFPEAYYILVDPLHESRPYMEKLVKTLPGGGEFHQVALGEENGEVSIEVRPDIGSSTIFEQVGGRISNKQYMVPMLRFDTLFQGREFLRPCLCKIDVQGAELLVLRGMGDMIKSIDMFIVEVHFIETLRGCPEIFDVLAYANEKTFVLLDIIGIYRRPLDNLAAQADIVLVPADSFLRRDKRWSQ